MDTATSAAVVSGVATFGGIVTLIITQHYQARRAREDRLAVQQKVATVADVLKTESTHTAEKLTEIHTLVDGNLSKLQKEFRAVKKLLVAAEATITKMQKPTPKKAPRK